MIYEIGSFHFGKNRLSFYFQWFFSDLLNQSNAHSNSNFFRTFTNTFHSEWSCFFLAKIITTCGFCCWLIIWVNCVLLAICCTAKVLPIHGILSAHFWPTITSFILIFLSFFQSINFIHNFPLLSDVNQQFTLEFGTNYCLLLPTFYLIARYSCYVCSILTNFSLKFYFTFFCSILHSLRRYFFLVLFLDSLDFDLFFHVCSSSVFGMFFLHLFGVFSNFLFIIYVLFHPLIRLSHALIPSCREFERLSGQSRPIDRSLFPI